ncbi:MAG TPA: UxaA family hydrolase [Opitutaceae bacterium]|nr:UxaA family hydrolase [Opitutaceae bacterium]
MPTPPTEPLSAVARLPEPGDNVAIAIRRLEAGASVQLAGGTVALPHTVLEGHRFAVQPIRPGERLLSWGQPFGKAIAPVAPGDYVCNQAVLDSLATRRLGASLPEKPNFEDASAEYHLDEAAFRPAPPNPRVEPARTFQGYARPGGRGAGTRNYIVVMGTSSRAASYARQLAARLRPLAKVFPGCDGIVPVDHTEGGGTEEPNNSAEVLRALAGFMVHPNVGAVLAVDYGVEAITNARLEAFLREKGYPIGHVPHRFLSIRSGLAAALAEGEAAVRAWLPGVAAARRTECPLAGLRIALQCGGSDAFSGISGNPLAGAVAHEAIRHGGSAVLCETDELVGAESYVAAKVKDLPTARALLGMIEGFKRRLSWHGITAESNPSGGNRLRGLYNIILKSLGATHKKDPRTRVDAAIDYAMPMGEPGFYFMNSPGNDLEGIAGQVASGCNLIVFVTGNGSVTNFPFVPTLKITTTTRRHELLIHEMDVNAGRYLDGTPMEALTAETFQLVIDTISGKKSKGEHAGHSQVQLWRNWRQKDTSRLAEIRSRAAPSGRPLPLAGTAPELSVPPLSLFRTPDGWATERVGLVLPTSMCSAQIAVRAAERLQSGGVGRAAGIARFVALSHTEGCGFGGDATYGMLHRTYRGYATHPNVAAALLLEHGCEKIPNDVMRRQFEKAGVPLERFGWASVQLDGGIDRALGRIEAWFTERFAALPPAQTTVADLGALRLGLLSAGPLAKPTAEALAEVARAVVLAGGTVLLPESDPLLAHPAFLAGTVGKTAPRATLASGEPLAQPGFHVVATESELWVENLAGLGGCGAHLFLTVVRDHPRQGHPLLPVIQLAEPGQRGIVAAEDIDGFLGGEARADAALAAGLVAAVASRQSSPRSTALGFTDFQLSRGLLGVST